MEGITEESTDRFYLKIDENNYNLKAKLTNERKY